jgi:hypothetical protein
VCTVSELVTQTPRWGTRVRMSSLLELNGDVTMGDDASVEGIKRRMREELVRAVPADRIDDRLKWLHEATQEPYKNVQRYLNGPNAPPLDFVVKYCDATGRTLDYIMAGRGPTIPTPPTDAERFAARVRELVEEIRPMPKEAFRAVPRPVDDNDVSDRSQ